MKDFFVPVLYYYILNDSNGYCLFGLRIIQDEFLNLLQEYKTCIDKFCCLLVYCIIFVEYKINIVKLKLQRAFVGPSISNRYFNILDNKILLRSCNLMTLQIICSSLMSKGSQHPWIWRNLRLIRHKCYKIVKTTTS